MSDTSTPTFLQRVQQKLQSRATAFFRSAEAYFKRNPRGIALFFIAVFFVAFNTLTDRAETEALARKSTLVRKFEDAPERWLKNPAEVSDFQQALNNGQLKEVAVASSKVPRELGLMLLYTRKDDKTLAAKVPGCTIYSACAGTAIGELSDLSAQKGFQLARIEIDWRTPTQVALDAFFSFTGAMSSLVVMIIAFALIMRMQGQMGGDTAPTLAEHPKVNFNDVVGASEAKNALLRVKTFLTDPSGYQAVGAKRPHGVLMKGPPGTGKTLLAKALAGECGANFIAVDGSYFTSMFYGMGVLKVRNLFKMARKHAPCILFIDEIDGIGRRTEGGQFAGSSELNRIINKVLVEMDGFGSNDSVVVIGATNHEENLDPAMRRPGRFDQVVEVRLPTVVERQQLFDYYLAKVRCEATELDAAAYARMTAGMSPADIANTVNKAASLAAEARASAVGSSHVLKAIENHQMGGDVSPVKDVITEDTRRRIAWHEAGHALVGHLVGKGRVERVSIEPRGSALGVTYVTRESEEPLYAQGELAGRLAMLLAGREAELLQFQDVSTGASDDLKRATELAIDMVSTLGFSEEFGLLSVAGVPDRLMAPTVQGAVLKEARAMLEQGQQVCKQTLTTHRARLEALAEALLESEVVHGDALHAILDGKTLPATV